MQFCRFVLKHDTQRIFKETIQRTIYTSEQLSIDNYVKERNQFQINLMKNSVAVIKERTQKNLLQPNVAPNVILNDLNSLLHLIEDTPEDFKLLENIVDKLKSNSNSDILRKSSIGTILMKALYHFKRGDLAEKFYNSPELRPFLMGKNCNLVFFDLLYKRKEYGKLLRHFEILRNQLEQKQQIIMRSIYVLIFATCYQQNTPESFVYASKLNEQYRDAHITQDHLIFFAALAINQNAPNIAEQIIKSIIQKNHEAIQNIRLLAALQMHKYKLALQILRSTMVIFDDNRTPKIDAFSSDTIEKADNEFNKCQNNDIASEYLQIRLNLKRHGYILDKKFDKMVFEPFRSTMTVQQHKKMVLDIEFNKIGQIS